MIRLEREVVEASARFAVKPWHPIDRNRLVDFCLSANLSDEQTAAVLGVANRRSIDFIEGRAGTGKTTTLQPLCRALEKNFRIIATGVSWRTARMLEDELSGPDPRSHVEARALDFWLALGKAGGHFCDGRTLLLVDESSQIGVRAMHNLLTEAERAGTCILFLGDRAQTFSLSRPVRASRLSPAPLRLRKSRKSFARATRNCAWWSNSWRRATSSPRWKRWPTATASSRQTVRLRPSK